MASCTNRKPGLARGRRLRPVHLGLAVALLVTAGGAAFSGEADAPRGALRAQATSPITGFTAPIQSVTLAAVRTGRVAERCVAEGAAVAVGDPIIRLGADVQMRRVELAEAAAETTVAIELAEIRLGVARDDLTRLRGARELSAATANELSAAEAAVRAAELELTKARFDHGQAGRELALERAILDEYTIVAPFGGVLTEQLKQVGDTVEDREGIAQLVQLDPLVVSVDCPIELAPQLRPDATAAVSGPEGFGAPRTAQVVYVSPVADAASQTFKVKLHVPNGDQRWLAGMRVNVTFEPAGNRVPPEAVAQPRQGR